MDGGCCWLFTGSGNRSCGSLGHSFGEGLERFFLDFRNLSTVSEVKCAGACLDKFKPTVISFSPTR